jgi:hypothetical protein
MSFVSFGNDEITKCPKLGDTIICHMCGKEHDVEYGEVIKEDGTREKSESIAFMKCNNKTYLVGINGRNITSKLKKIQ